MGQPKRGQGKRSFTLVELLVVMGIIAMLAGLLMPALRKMVERSNEDAARAELEMARAALDEYYEDYGQYPHVIPYPGQTKGLSRALHMYYECKFLYIADEYCIDPFDTPYYYDVEPLSLTPDDVSNGKGRPVLASYGPDSAKGDEGSGGLGAGDDIVVR